MSLINILLLCSPRLVDVVLFLNQGGISSQLTLELVILQLELSYGIDRSLCGEPYFVQLVYGQITLLFHIFLQLSLVEDMDAARL